MTPSANWATSLACSALETPRPTHTGSDVTARVRATSSSASRPTDARVPVTPIRDAA